MASYDSIAIIHESFEVRRSSGEITDLRDPQHLLHETNLNKDRLSAEIRDNPGSHAFFLKMKQGKLEWWQPVDIELRPAEQLTVSKAQPPNKLRFAIQNNTQEVVDGSVHIIVGQDTLQQMLTIPARASSNSITVNSAGLLPGSNNVRVQLPNGEYLEKIITNWKIDAVLLQDGQQWDFVDLSDRFNEQVTQIFKNRYYEPRPDAPTLQLPLQGIGNWTHPKVQPEIDDSGLRQRAGAKGRFSLENDIPFKTPGLSEGPNILFVSRWENYPNQVKLPLNGHARHMYL